MDLVDLLRASEATTVERLAEELGCSTRTVRRDIATLRFRGLPIRGESGPGGGLRLDGPRGVSTLNLSIAEVVALWLAARLSNAVGNLPWSKAATSGLTKLLASAPKARVKELRALCRRVIIGPPPGVELLRQAGRSSPELLRLFELSFSTRRALGFHYVDAKGAKSKRRVEPHGLLVQAPIWYLLSRDLDKAEPRMFRMDRISRPRVLEGPTFEPDFDVIWSQLAPESEWEAMMGGVDGRANAARGSSQRPR